MVRDGVLRGPGPRNRGPSTSPHSANDWKSFVEIRNDGEEPVRRENDRVDGNRCVLVRDVTCGETGAAGRRARGSTFGSRRIDGEAVEFDEAGDTRWTESGRGERPVPATNNWIVVPLETARQGGH